MKGTPEINICVHLTNIRLGLERDVQLLLSTTAGEELVANVVMFPGGNSRYKITINFPKHTLMKLFQTSLIL